MRIEPRDYHAVAATAPDVALEVGKLAGHRMAGPGGFQGLASKPERPRATIGHPSDRVRRRFRRFLDRNWITFTWLQPDIPEEAEQWCRSPSPPRAIRRSESSTARPSSVRTATAGGRAARARTRPCRAEYDTVIVGAGPAGLAAAVFYRGFRGPRRRHTVEQGGARGAGGHVVPMRTTSASRRRVRRGAGEEGSRAGWRLGGRDPRDAVENRGDVAAPTWRRRGRAARPRTIILACGVTWRRLAIGKNSSTRLAGNGIFFAARRDARARTASTSTSSGPAVRPGRRPSHSRPTRAA